MLEGAGDLELNLPDGRHTLILSATDAAGNRTQKELDVTVDTTGPAVTWSPAVPSRATTAALTLRGTVTDTLSGLRSLTISGRTISPSTDGTFSSTITLAEGANAIAIEAEDTAGNKSKAVLAVTYVRTTTIVLVIGRTTMLVDDKTVAIDTSGKVAPIIQNSRTLLPIRALIETLGGTVGWDPVARKATLALKGTTLQLWIGKATATVNGRSVQIDAADKRVVPVITVGRTLLPLRFVAESLGLDIVWDAALRSITLDYAP
jgi:hypothetical protein